MMFLNFLLALTLSGLTYSFPSKGDDELKAVVVLFRHGDRAPLSSWPNDVYFSNSSLWPDGHGQLNNMGKQHHYELGQWFRERYDNFLPKRYNRDDIYVRSTDVDRTLQSAASNLAGLYPPEGDQIWNDNVQWQPVPIHTVQQSDDYILGTSYPCPKHGKLVDDLLKSDQFQKLNEDLAEFYKNFSDSTGFSSVDVTTFAGVYSTLGIYKEFNLALPEWTETYWNQIAALAAIDFQLDTYTVDLAKLRVGPFFDYLINYFQNVKNNVLLETEHVKGPKYQSASIADSLAQKFLMLSAHDGTVADRTNAMGVYNDAAPEFTSTIIWELKNGQNGSYVNMYFKNTTHFTELTLPSCEFNCPFDDFVKGLEPITLNFDQWVIQCNEE